MEPPSAQVHSRLHAEVAAIETLARDHQFAVRHDMLTKVRHQLPALAALVDFWWAGVDQDLEQAAISAPWRQWARECLLPWVYWEHQGAHTLRAEESQDTEGLGRGAHRICSARHHPAACPPCPGGLARGPRSRSQRFSAPQRWKAATVLSRNSITISGLPKRRYKVWTVLHN